MSLEQLRREIEALRPGPVTVDARFPDGSRRTLSLEEFLQEDTADFDALHGGNVQAVKLVLDKYGPSIID